MKKGILFAFVLIFVISESIFGQFNLEFGSGINYSKCTLQGDDPLPPERRLGYFFGLAPSCQINDKLNFIVDFQYSQKGYSMNTDRGNEPTQLVISYFDIIPEIEYRVLNNLKLGLGLNYGTKLSEQINLNGTKWAYSDQIPKTIALSDFGLVGKLKVTYKSIFVFTRYNYGIKDIYKSKYANTNHRFLNQNLQIGIGYKLHPKKV